MSFSLAYLSLLRITLVPPGLDPGSAAIQSGDSIGEENLFFLLI